MCGDCVLFYVINHTCMVIFNSGGVDVITALLPTDDIFQLHSLRMLISTAAPLTLNAVLPVSMTTALNLNPSLPANVAIGSVLSPQTGVRGLKVPMLNLGM